MCYTEHSFFVQSIIKNHNEEDSHTTMESVYTTYLEIIKNACNSSHAALNLSPETQTELSALAQRHFTAPFVLPYVTNAVSIQSLKRQTTAMTLNYYQIEQFTRKIVHLFDTHKIPYFLLKGISLAAYYPLPEYRKLGDVDLYINEPEALSRAKSVLKENGFIDLNELSDHHVTYQYTFPKTGRSFILELHFRIVGLYQYVPANAVIDRVYSPSTLKHDEMAIGEESFSVLPPTEYTFYMLHHMLKHYLYSGFGIRLLCDFTFYLRVHHKEIDFEKIHKWCRQSHIFHLYEIIVECCRLYLGLSDSIDPDVHYLTSDCELFITHVLDDKDMGSTDNNTLVGSGSYKKVNLLTYFKEGHLQMHVRFPKLGKCPLLWPALWAITLFYFIKNTYCLRHTTLKDTLKSFQDTNQKSKLIRIFDNHD